MHLRACWRNCVLCDQWLLLSFIVHRISQTSRKTKYEKCQKLWSLLCSFTSIKRKKHSGCLPKINAWWWRRRLWDSQLRSNSKFFAKFFWSQVDSSLFIYFQRIPLFLPIIRSSLSTTHPREPDIVDRLDSGALQNIVGLLEGLMKQNADLVASDQNQLTQSSKDIEAQLAAIMMALTERQKLYAKYAEKLARIHEVSHSLTRCHLALATAMDSIETLNRQLPIPERLEEFIWSTG